ncbi:hypothetical protein HNQ35_000646 [Cerasibacillus quisquiliarum]|uniref:DUF2627 domain-containing protein n=1 Tax=Cerasibacillus quisquiliarum TaxID=227865 RepID=A0A511UZG0_9BACI|nr:DUF2627 domain-containing protein [Cerasibacillus quisquiliarum]MBB5145454.1 hypothetical protein [Cerasibacillus quisquiliarum]GEN31151.1 hypothetical protein CQU01_13890 [Cerasibacillus quisquiliarum]
MGRIIAFLLLLIPGVLSVIGIKLMRDTLFNEFHPIFLHTSIQFIVGLILLVGGFMFIGGFIVHRDRKKNLITKEKK